VFKFKGSKKSNNGTDVNAGQIPQLLYRLPSRDTTAVTRKSETTESAHVLSQEFSCSVSPVSLDGVENELLCSVFERYAINKARLLEFIRKSP